MTGLPDAESHD